MDVSKIVRLVAVLFAVVAGLVTIPQSALIIAVLGLVAGYFIEQERVVYILAATLVLNVANAGLGPIPGVGEYLTGIFTSLSALFNAGALTVITIATYNALKP
ncbi:MAG: hypothetical protein ACE5KS_05040 [Woeseiaceae bacterium]